MEEVGEMRKNMQLVCFYYNSFASQMLYIIFSPENYLFIYSDWKNNRDHFEKDMIFSAFLFSITSVTL